MTSMRKSTATKKLQPVTKNFQGKDRRGAVDNVMKERPVSVGWKSAMYNWK